MTMLSSTCTRYHIVPNDDEGDLDLDFPPGHHRSVSDPADPHRRRRGPYCKALIIFVLLSLLSACLVFTGWMISETRQELLAVQYVKCASPPWWLFSPRPRSASSEAGQYSHYSTVALRSIPGQGNGNGTGDSRIGMVQTCSVPVKKWSLKLLLENHREYAERWDVPWQVRVDIPGGTWSKIVAIRDWMRKELEERPEDERLQWLFFTDIDTMLVNPEVELTALLPPRGIAENAFLIMTKDRNGWNSGAWLVRVHERSASFLDEVMSYQHHIPPLCFAEQSAIALLAEKYQLEQKREMVAMPQRFINSYEGQKRYEDPKDAFLVHWPSLQFKRREMLPFLRKLIRGEIKQDKRKFAQGREIFLREVRKFWRSFAAEL